MRTELERQVIIAQQAQALVRAHGSGLWPGWGELPLTVGIHHNNQLWLVGHPAPPADFSLHNGLPSGPMPQEVSEDVIVSAGAETALMPNASAPSGDLLLSTLCHLFHSYQRHHAGALAQSPGSQVVPACLQDQNIRTLVHHIGYSLWRSGTALSDQELCYEADAIKGLRQVLAELLASRSGSPTVWTQVTRWEWRLGVARYSAARILEAAAGAALEPAYAALADAETPEQLWSRTWQKCAQELRDAGLKSLDSSGFAALGYGLALLLDRLNPHWRQHYLQATLDQLFT